MLSQWTTVVNRYQVYNNIVPGKCSLQGLRMGREGQQIDLFDPISDRVKTVITHHMVYACVEGKIMPRDRYRLTVDYFCRFLRGSDSNLHHISIG